jgi:type 1 glutamine amidotransferase
VRRVLLVACVAALVIGCAEPGAPSPPGESGSAPIRVLMLTATLGFRHGSIPVAIETVTGLGSEFAVTHTEDVTSITALRLAGTDVLMFALTSGELPFDASQRAAILDFIARGGGFVGVHSATDTLYDWPEYGQLVGAYFSAHPWTQDANVIVENGSHPSTAALGASFRITEEFYTFRQNPRPNVQVLLALEAASVGASGDFPLAWSRAQGNGRAYYNALGHFDSTWRDPRFQAQLRGALRWTARRAD